MGHVERVRERSDAYRGLMGKLKGKRQLGRRRYRWEDNIEIYPQDVGWERGLNLSDLGQGHVASSRERGTNLRAP